MGPDGVILVHSVPSGVIALSRSLTRERRSSSGSSRSGFGIRSSCPALLQGRAQVALVQVHNIGLALTRRALAQRARQAGRTSDL